MNSRMRRISVQAVGWSRRDHRGADGRSKKEGAPTAPPAPTRRRLHRPLPPDREIKIVDVKPDVRQPEGGDNVQARDRRHLPRAGSRAARSHRRAGFEECDAGEQAHLRWLPQGKFNEKPWSSRCPPPSGSSCTCRSTSRRKQVDDGRAAGIRVTPK